MVGETHDQTVLPLDPPAAAKRRHPAGKVRGEAGRQGFHQMCREEGQRA